MGPDFRGTRQAALGQEPAGGGEEAEGLGSAAAKTGTNLSPEVTDDLEGDVRPQGGAYDIGCYEDW